MDFVELLIGIAEIAVALAGFTGVVVTFGSRSQGAWHPGDRLRLSFLLMASLTAAGFALLSLLALSSNLAEPTVWSALSALWALFMCWSLWASRQQMQQAADVHQDIDKLTNAITTTCFVLLIFVQILNATLWHEFYPFLAAIMLNLVGAAMQFARLIRSAFHD